MATAVTLSGLLGACTTKVPLAPGCRPWRSSDTSTEPPAHCLFFPAGVAIDPMADLLYVANSNADLSFGGGTLAAVDLLRFEKALRDVASPQYAQRKQQLCGSSGRSLGLSASYEDAEALDRSGGRDPRDLDFCYCDRDLLDPLVTNCESFRFILRDHTVKTGNFSGQVQVLADDPGDLSAVTELRRGVYLPVRGDPSLTMVEVRRPLGAGAAAGLKLTCDSSFVDRPAGVAMGACDRAHRVQQLIGPVGDVLQEVPAEPFSTAITEGCEDPRYTVRRLSGGPACVDKAGAAQASPARYLLMGHLLGGELSLFSLGPALGAAPAKSAADGLPALTYVRASTFPSDSAGRRGTYGLAHPAAGDLFQPWFVTSRISGQIASFRMSFPVAAQPPVLSRDQNYDLTAVLPGTQDLRDLQFEPGGARAFAVANTPPSLLILDARLDARTGTPLMQVTGRVDICPEPARMTLVRQQGPRGITTQIYIACYLAGQIAVIDPDLGALVNTIQVGRGPLAMALNFSGVAGNGSIDPCADSTVPRDAMGRAGGVQCPAADLHPRAGTDPIRQRGYVATYLDSAISVIDLDPSSATYHRVVGRIGLPSPKQVQ